MSTYSARQRSKRQQLLGARAHGTRRALSPAEARLWFALGGGQLGVTFRRQVVLGQRYIADFLARDATLIVEVDGAQHAESRAADAKRDRYLATLGYRTLRIPVQMVQNELGGVVALIRAALQQ